MRQFHYISEYPGEKSRLPYRKNKSWYLHSPYNTTQIENVVDIPQNPNPEPETFDKKNLTVSQTSNSSNVVVEKPSDFFEEVTDAFSSLGSLFDFLD